MKVEDHASLEELRAWERAQTKPAASRRFRAVILAKKGETAKSIAKFLEIADRTVQTWVQNYNLYGPEALETSSRDKSHSRNLKPELEQAFKARVLAGPTPEDGVGRFTGKDLQRILAEEFDAHYNYRAVYAVLKRLDLRWMTGRKFNEKKRQEEYDKFLEEAPLFSKN